MGCSNEHSNSYGGNDCVTDIVRRIAKAQREAVESDTDSCVTSCEQSIEDLLSPCRDRRPSRHTTIPFMLVCKDSCKTFIGSGFIKGRGNFMCVESPVFKVRGFVRGSNHCVRLELLTPVYSRRRDGESTEETKQFSHHGGNSSCDGSICNYFGGRPIENFRETGVCITVDLRCFCGVSCLDPITPVRTGGRGGY